MPTFYDKLKKKEMHIPYKGAKPVPVKPKGY